MSGNNSGPRDARAQGETPSSPVPTLEFRSDFASESQRVALFREVFGAQYCGIDVEPLSDGPFNVAMQARALPGISLSSAEYSPLRCGRTRKLIADGNDDLLLGVPMSKGIAHQCGHETALEPGDGIVMSNADIGDMTLPSGGTLLIVGMPRTALSALVRDGEDVVARRIPAEAPALKLIKRYFAAVHDEALLANKELRDLVAMHFYDLAALALGATQDAAEHAKQRGVRAARLRTIKSYVETHLASCELSVAAAAAHFRLTPRYIQMLFEGEGTTFTEFVREMRLIRAHRALANRRFDDRSVGDIAWDAGFGDLSYFNRTFRRRFGLSPSGVRSKRGEEV